MCVPDGHHHAPTSLSLSLSLCLYILWYPTLLLLNTHHAISHREEHVGDVPPLRRSTGGTHRHTMYYSLLQLSSPPVCKLKSLQGLPQPHQIRKSRQLCSFKRQRTFDLGAIIPVIYNWFISPSILVSLAM